MTLQVLSTDAAQDWFESLPTALRLVTLSPRFALADEARGSGLRATHLGFEQGGAHWLHTTHLRALGADGDLGAMAPYGYGGPLADSHDPVFLARAWSAYTHWCRDERVAAEFCRFHPVAAHAGFYRGAVTLNRQTVIVDLAVPDLQSQYSTLARRKIRRALAQGATARFSREPGDWLRFAAFYREGMRAIGAAPSYLFADAYFERMATLPDSALCICEIGGSWCSGAVYLFGPEVVEYHLGASSAAGLQTGTPYLLQHAAAERGVALGARWLFLGGGTTPEADNPLLFYKKNFSRRLLPFFTGEVLHDPDRYWELGVQAGYSPADPPPGLLFD